MRLCKRCSIISKAGSKIIVKAVLPTQRPAMLSNKLANVAKSDNWISRLSAPPLSSTLKISAKLILRTSTVPFCGGFCIRSDASGSSYGKVPGSFSCLTGARSESARRTKCVASGTYRFDRRWYWTHIVTRYVPIPSLDSELGDTCPSHWQITIIAGVTTWWKWSLVGNIVLIAVKRIKSPAFKSSVERCSCMTLKCLRKALDTVSG